jgi:hypothetical protein
MEVLASATPKTPEITYDEAGKRILISGRSYPEDLHAFWDPITAKLEEIILSSDSILVQFDLNYHNSGSTRIILNLIKFCESDQASGCDISMEWQYDPDDEQTEEQGEDYRDICTKIDFKMVPTE